MHLSSLLKPVVALCAFAATLSFACAQDFSSASFLRSFVVSDPSLTPPAGSRSQVSMGDKWNSKRRGGESPEDSYVPTDLVYIVPGGLEPSSSGPGFFFAYDELLGSTYVNGTFSFSGRADSLFWQPQTGWSSEDVNQDLQPLLVRSDKEDVNEPYYEFCWQKQTNIQAPGDSIYLNYNFKIPKQSRLLGPEQLRVKRQYFDRSFSVDAPRVVDGKACIWDNGSLYVYDADLSGRSALEGWDNLPSDCMATSFAVSSDKSRVVASTAGLYIVAFKKGSSDPVWKTPGSGPVTIIGRTAFAMTPDFSAIQAIRLSDGKARPIANLPRFLPRTPDSFATAKLSDGRNILLLLVPSQSKVMAFEVR